ncbi:MAG TPA: hypothetical protein VMV10_14085 [Pirellulales bacterium]|nr:hypothetical protein [Pirellulales bacterium]
MSRNLCLLLLGASLASGLFSTASAGESLRFVRVSQAQAPDAEPIPAGENEEGNWRYRRQQGRWWYWTDENRWVVWNGSTWVAPSTPSHGPGALAQTPLEGRGVAEPANFRAWFDAYRNFKTGRAALQAAEEGGVEMGTAEITAEPAAGEVFEFGGIPGRQTQWRRRSAMSGAIRSGGSWFSAGSPFGIEYGYGSGYGYGGYGFANPYGYGSRTGSGGAYGYGFGAFGSVGGQTGERLSSLITGGAESRLIGPEPPSIGAPSKLESTVGGTAGRAGAGARSLGGSAAGD